MDTTLTPGTIIILNGAPRSGKSSIAAAMQESFDGIWMNLGVDGFMDATPTKYRPGMGLRPGEPEHPVYPLVPGFYAAFYESVAAVARTGLNVVVDVGHHDADVLRDCARRLDGLPVLFIGVHCPVEEVMRRRLATWGPDERITDEDPVPEPVLRWQRAVHGGWPYDLELDTSKASAAACAEEIRSRLAAGPGTAFAAIAKG